MRVKLTENQLERLKSINEGSDSTFNREVSIDFDYKNRDTYKGYEISYIANAKMRVYFDIDIEYKSWGISDISIGNLKGTDDSVETTIELVNGNGDFFNESVTIDLNWEHVVVEYEESNGIATIGDEISVMVKEVDGKLVCQAIHVIAYKS